MQSCKSYKFQFSKILWRPSNNVPQVAQRSQAKEISYSKGIGLNSYSGNVEGDGEGKGWGKDWGEEEEIDDKRWAQISEKRSADREADLVEHQQKNLVACKHCGLYFNSK